MHNPPTCSGVARTVGVTLPGTAPLARGYLLVSYPGPWPAKPFAQFPQDPEAGQRIVDRTSSHSIRPLFIRRPGSQHAPHQREFAWAYVDALAGVTTWHEPAPLSVIAEVDWPDPGSAAGPADSNPLYLVCTHGRRDQCCATLGRPVAADLAALRPHETWECSHVGGHRLAGVVVALPHGNIYGLVDPEDVQGIISATEGGGAYLSRLRGCSLDEPAAQAAKAAVLRQRHDSNPRSLITASCIQVDESSPMGEVKWLVTLQHVDDSELNWKVEVLRRPAGLAPASCGKEPTETFAWVASTGHRTLAEPRV